MMEGVGARLGRSSTRYGPTTVFNGPVRKWKKKWVHVSPPYASSNHHSQISNGSTNGNNGSHLLFYKWTPITQSHNNSDNNGDNKSSAKEDAAAAAAATTATEEPPRRKFKFIPIAVLEEQKSEAIDLVEDEAKLIETDLPNAAVLSSRKDGIDEKPDINDVPMEESQALDDKPVARQDLNASTLDLSLGLKSHDGDNDSDSKRDQTEDGQ